MKETHDSKNIIKSALKIFHLLEILVENNKLTVSELSELTGYSKSTTQRIVNTLKYLKYIDQDTTTLEYFSSIKLYELGNSVVNNLSLTNVAKPFLLQLYGELNETVNLGILDGNSVIYLDKLVSRSPLKAELELGTKVPIYCSALGKAIAAFSNKSLLLKFDYTKYTQNTITSDKELYHDLSQVRKQGYAIDNEEYVDGLICIAAPILNPNGNAVAAISISIPAIRFDYNNIDYYTSMLKHSAAQIGKSLY